MATDRSLASLLRALQDASNWQQDISRLLGSAATLLTLLSNPLNVTLLTVQLLSAPAIWSRPDGLRTAVQVLGIFNSASIQMLKNQERSSSALNGFEIKNKLAAEDWTVAVIRGANDRSPRWRHLLALGGLLLGLERQQRKGFSTSLRAKLESAMVKALNLALQETEEGPELSENTIVMTLSHVFDLLSDHEKNNINHDVILSRLYSVPFFSGDGLHFGYFLSTMDADIVEGPSKKFDWSTKSSTYFQIQRMASGPLVAALGSLSRVISYSIDHVQNLDTLATMIGDMSTFTRSLCIQWRQNKLSEIDSREESTYLSDDTIRTSLPLLWRILKSTMFSIVMILKSLLGRVLGDASISADSAFHMAIQTLHILRNLSFIFSRMGMSGFSQYAFVSLTAIDILSQHPVQAEVFLQEIRPAGNGLIPEHPLDRCHDLFFLNTAEHFTLILTPQANEDLLITAATRYLGVGSDRRLREIFEAAHSVMLAVFSAPQSSELVAKYIHPYVDALFTVFPQNLSSRQFRIAVKTLVRIASPPSIISATQPMLSSVLLELVRVRAADASSSSLQDIIISPELEGSTSDESRLSEQSVLALTLVDALPFLSLDCLEEWLPITAETLNIIQNATMKDTCKQRFWDILSNGEMDVDRAALCATWWNTRDGRNIVLNGAEKHDDVYMSGGLGEPSKL